MLKEPKAKQPLWKENDYKAQKKGIRHTVYSVNGDQYTGEWLDNLKDGESYILFCIRIELPPLLVNPICVYFNTECYKLGYAV